MVNKSTLNNPELSSNFETSLMVNISFCVCRYMSYVDENQNTLTSLGWVSDPLLLYEK